MSNFTTLCSNIKIMQSSVVFGVILKSLPRELKKGGLSSKTVSPFITYWNPQSWISLLSFFTTTTPTTTTLLYSTLLYPPHLEYLYHHPPCNEINSNSMSIYSRYVFHNYSLSPDMVI